MSKLIFARSRKKGEYWFLLLDDCIDEEDFLLRVGAREGSYAGELGRRLYRALFCEAVNVVDEYERYYVQEYESVIKYMESEYGLRATDLQVIKEGVSSDQMVLHTSPHASSEDSLSCLLDSDSMRKTLMSLISGGSR